MKNEKSKNILLAVLLVAIVTLTIAYAALSATLTINATAVVKGNQNNWKVEFVETATLPATTCVASNYASVETQPTISATAFTGLVAHFKAPGDKVTCTWNVENNGSIDAYLKTFTKSSTYSYSGASGDVSKVDGNINYTLTYSNDTAINAGTSSTGDQLPADTTTGKKGLKLVIEFNPNATELPAADVTVTGFDTIFLYEQK